MNRLFIVGIMTCMLAIQGMTQTINPVTRIENMSVITLHLEAPYLYVGGTDRFRIFDISDGGNPVELGSMPVDTGVQALSVMGDIAILGLDTRGTTPNLLIVDISDKANPRQLFARLADAEGGLVNDIHVVGDTAFTSVGDRIISLQLSDTNEPVSVGSTSLGFDIFEMINVGNRLYVAADIRIFVLDITDPANLSTISTTETFDFNNGLDIDNGILAVAEGIEGLALYDLSNPDQPSLINTLFLPGDNEIFGVDIRQQFVYIAALSFPSLSIFDLPQPGGLRIVDIENISNARQIFENEIPGNDNGTAYDVIAYNGYVYVSEDGSLAVFRHGPPGEQTRPTSTPIVPTATRTPTNTATPTNTPPLLATATPRQQAPTNTPTPRLPNTPIPPPPTNTPVPNAPTATFTNTQVPVQPTLPPADGLTALIVADFDGPVLANEQFADLLPFTGDFTKAAFSIGSIPTDNAFAGATNGRGIAVTANPGEAIMLLGPFVTLAGNYPVLLRVNVRSTGPGATIALAGVDGGDSTVSLTNPANSGAFAGAYKRLSIVFKAPTNSLFPLLQVVASGDQQVTVYFDNFELIPLPPGTVIPVEELGVGITAP